MRTRRVFSQILAGGRFSPQPQQSAFTGEERRVVQVGTGNKEAHEETLPGTLSAQQPLRSTKEKINFSFPKTSSSGSTAPTEEGGSVGADSPMHLPAAIWWLAET